MIEDRILFVDDDTNILEAYHRMLVGRLDVRTAEGGSRGLELIDKEGPFAVVISDLRMPKMDGIEFLAKVAETSPDSVRMMLTGNADLQTAIKAVNEGAIFRFLTKPCPADVLVKSLVAGINQHRLVTAEKELLEKTFSGSIKLLMDILTIVAPDAFSRASRFRDVVRKVAEELNLDNVWDIEMAWMLSHVGYVMMPEHLAEKQRTGEELTADETKMIEQIPNMVEKLLSNIPRLETSAQIVARQNARYDSRGEIETQDKEIHVGAEILKVVADIAQLESAKVPKNKLFETMRSRSGWYDPIILETAERVISSKTGAKLVQVNVKVGELRIDDLLITDVYSTEGSLLIAAGTRVTEVYLERVKNFDRFIGVEEPIVVKRLVKSRRR